MSNKDKLQPNPVTQSEKNLSVMNRREFGRKFLSFLSMLYLQPSNFFTGDSIKKAIIQDKDKKPRQALPDSTKEPLFTPFIITDPSEYDRLLEQTKTNELQILSIPTEILLEDINGSYYGYLEAENNDGKLILTMNSLLINENINAKPKVVETSRAVLSEEELNKKVLVCFPVYGYDSSFQKVFYMLYIFIDVKNRSYTTTISSMGYMDRA